jgi:activator of 2-hydroxyglutaryl-CoA dehydratase
VQAKRPCGGKKSDCRSAAEDGVKAISADLADHRVHLFVAPLVL